MTLAPGIGSALEGVVGREYLRTDEESLRSYGRDTCDMFPAAPAAVVFPGSTSEVREIVLLANEHQMALVPSGGRTGLSGGATAASGEVVVSLERMNRVIEARAADRSVRCQAGVVTARLHRAASEQGLFYPVDFAATGSSHVAGNVATNAGGSRVIRYGMTRNWVSGLEVVTGKGEVLSLGHDLVKDNTGYDLKQLFIGSEGTLGIITEATMRLTRAPAEPAVMVLGLGSLENLLPVLQAFQARVTLNAFEFFTQAALDRVVARHGLQRPFDTATPVYALIDFEAGAEGDLGASTQAFEHCVDAGWVEDGTVSQSRRQARELWRLRDDISETLSHWQPYKNDLSVRVSLVPEFLAGIAAIVERRYPQFEVLWYGHIGDGNVHLNILRPGDMPLDAFRERCTAVSEEIFALTSRFEGSISAEHGVGLLKKPYLAHGLSSQEIVLMKTIKRALDPNGVMNPGKIFD